jgi:hypothetical protein
MPDKPAESLVALRERREAAIELLGTRYAQDVLELDEFERRVELAQHAATVAELAALVADLDAPAATTALAPVAKRELVPADAVPAKKTLVAIFGGVSRKGGWIVPRRLRTFTVMGGAELDFREARLGPGVHDVTVFCVMGGVEIIVPPGLNVDVEGVGLMGGFEQGSGRVDVDPQAPTLRVRGVAIMGGVDVNERLPGESGRQARKRRRRERREKRELAETGRRALPEARVHGSADGSRKELGPKP